MLSSFARNRGSAIPILVVFTVVVTLFSGYHNSGPLIGQGTSHHSDDFTCVFTICVAIVLFSTLLILFMFTKALPEPIPAPKMNPLFLLEKPPRGQFLK